jgi:hypothetical protein
MRGTLVFLALLGLALADESSPLYKGAKITPVGSASKVSPKAVQKAAPVDLKVSESKQTPAQDRQDQYGAPAAPAVDTYGSPQAPAQDTYGAPVADPVAKYDQPGEVGTQGYYYYYYPVANSYPSSTSHNSKVQASSSSGGGLGLTTILLIGGLVAVLAVVALAFSGTGRRSLSDWSMDVDKIDSLAYQVYQAFDIYKNL